MSGVLQAGTGVAHRFVFELRYESGELYWDRCGRAARHIASQEGWAVQSIDTTGCHIRNDDKNLTFSYSPTKLDLTQCQNSDVLDLLSASEFAAIAEEFSEVVVRTLDVARFPRIGFRMWLLYQSESLDDASARIARMPFFQPCDALKSLGDLSYPSHSVVLTRPQHMIRVAVTPFEQQVHVAPSVMAAARKKAFKHWKDQKALRLQQLRARKAIKSFPQVGVMLDMDAYIEDPLYPDQVSVRTFIIEARRGFGNVYDAILSEKA